MPEQAATAICDLLRDGEVMEYTTVSSKAISAQPEHRFDAEFWLTHCHDCQAEFKPAGSAPGYAVRVSDHARVCYDCADKEHRVELQTYADTVAYVSNDGKQITTWTGGKLMDVTSEVKHRAPRPGLYYPLSQRLWYYQATDVHGNRWYGKGSGRGMLIRMHKAKA